MAQHTKISWTDATWNPWHGCQKVSDGCKFCYMYRDKERYGQNPSTVLRSKSTFDDPLHFKLLPGSKIFTCSWSDFFIEEADEWRPATWEIIRNTPQYIYQILTKRPERISKCLPANGIPRNVWIGVSVENRKTVERINRLALVPDIPVRFISFEPLLEDIVSELMPVYLTLVAKYDWFIIGGESGNEKGKYTYRPCEIEWIQRLMEALPGQIFIKQLGTHLAKELNLKDRHGTNPNEWPVDLRGCQNFPIL